ncbi:hypothetical protein CAPTEDRAFT_222070 [Capitella teleta]|uniref:Enoyl reductase (ER) domain-containing protein n=1 Tax=Capitella teleta TaxID=283909 RepID=R7TCQ2_CAPTE|nr:hypothetical protein CAPTEDRAFT_222070 [Capitella teleta]|eukprot:ELT91523.1 hypothetical protein CAPTEDRAFT_222070 [Capitella teleta]
MNRKLCLVDYYKPFEFVEEPIHKPPPKGAIVKVTNAGVCHSDVLLWQKEFDMPNQRFPVVLGHETAGTLFAVGNEAETELSVGDRVVVFTWTNCGECYNCVNDRTNCPNLLPTHQTIKTPNIKTYGLFNTDGGFQTHLAVDDVSSLLRIPEAVPSDIACLCACGGITAMNAITKIRPAIDEAINLLGQARVALVGAGGIAQWAIQICKAFFGDKVIICAIDVRSDKLEDAKKIGADVTVCWAKEPEKTPEAVMQVIDNCGGRVNAGVDFTGRTTSLSRLVAASQMAASIALVGLSKEDQFPPLPINSYIFLGLSFHTVYAGSKRSLVQLLDLINEGKVKPPTIHHVTLEQVNATLEKVMTGEQSGRAVVCMD